MARDPQTRRTFLRTLSLSALALVGAWRFLTPARVPDAARVSVRAADVPEGGALVLPEQGVAVTRLEGGALTALSLRCTHLGCLLVATEDGFACPCHGSAFDPHGRVLRGPAREPLHHLSCTLRDGVLHVRT